MTAHEARARELRAQKDIAHTLEGIASTLESVRSRILLGDDASSKLPIQEHYKLFRDYVEHEDSLIDHRLLWNINIQGFLFATYGFSVQKLAEVQIHSGAQEIIGAQALYWLIGVLPFFGIAVSVWSFLGVIAAQDAIASLTKQWEEIEGEYRKRGSTLALPKLIGGGDLKAHKWGFLAPKSFPWVFVAAWALLLIHYGIVLGHFWKH
jgi:hypothetical protein